MRKYAVELIGTFIFVFSILGALSSGSPLAPLGIGATLMVMVYAGGHISGGHFNPAVSLAAWVRGRLDTADLIPYWAAQLLGALGAGLLGMWFWDNGGAAALEGKDLWLALVAEFIFTFALAWVVLNVATSSDHPDNSFYGLAIGFTVVAGVIAVGGISGGAFNPAVALGVTVNGLSAWGHIWIYVVGCLAGGALAGLAFRELNPDDE